MFTTRVAPRRMTTMLTHVQPQSIHPEAKKTNLKGEDEKISNRNENENENERKKKTKLTFQAASPINPTINPSRSQEYEPKKEKTKKSRTVSNRNENKN